MTIENYSLALASSHAYEAERTSTLVQYDTEEEVLPGERDERRIVSAVQSGVAERGIALSETERKLLTELIGSLQNATRHASVFELHEQVAEREQVEVSMQGFVTAGDRKIAVDIEVALARQSVFDLRIDVAKLIDPLVINLDGGMPELSDKRFSFDIDSDGAPDQISMLKHGSGFLALDRNHNGVIDEGGELFGAQSGDGFSELGAFDEDGNGWIDENDPIFSGLRIWMKHESGSRLIALGEAGVGAIYLGSTQSDFAFKDSLGDALGALRRSGLFLFEDGRSGIVSQLDLARRNPSDQGQTPSQPLEQAQTLTRTEARLDGLKRYREESDPLENAHEGVDRRIEALKSKIETLRRRIPQEGSEAMQKVMQTQMGVYENQVMALMNLQLRRSS